MSHDTAVIRVLVGCVLCAGTAGATAGVEAASGQPVATTQPQVGTDGPAIVVVRAFSNITGLLADDWMGAGIAETVSTSLEDAEGLAVVRDGLINPDERPVSWIVTGAYQRLRNRLRITARITPTDTEAAPEVGLVMLV